MSDPKTLTELRDEIELVLHDSSNATYGTTDIDQAIKEALYDLSGLWPRMDVKEVRQTTASSFEVTVSDIVNLIAVRYLEWKTGQNPPTYRNVDKRYGGVITIKIDSRPSTAEDIYLFCDKNHTLVEPMDDLAGAVNNAAGYAIGDTSIVIDGLGTGTIYEGTLLTFADINGEYRVTANATITTNAATVLIEPGLQEAVLNNVVVTFVCSTLNRSQEDCLVPLAAGYAMRNYGIYLMNTVTTGAGGVGVYLKNSGLEIIGDTRTMIKRLMPFRSKLSFTTKI